MSPLLIIDKIHRSGGSIWGEDGDLRIEVDSGLLTAEDMSVLARHKADLVPLLARPVRSKDSEDREAIQWIESLSPEESEEVLKRATSDFDLIVAEDQSLDDWLVENTVSPLVCEQCGYLDRWQDLADGWHCLLCDPPVRAQKLRQRAERNRPPGWGHCEG